MKNVPALSVIAAALLAAGCGGGSSSPDPIASPPPATLTGSPPTSTVLPVASPTIAISGKAMNVGYLGNTVVCADLNDNGLCDVAEPQATTSSNGDYNLTVPTGSRGAALLAIVRPSSTDSASTTASPIEIKQGWVLAHQLEYADDAKTASANISPISSTYYARIRLAGRNRLANQIAMFTRIVFETGTNTANGQLVTPYDFDYVANPRNALGARIKALNNVLSSRANLAGAPIDLVGSAGLMSAWYNTYAGPTATSAGIPVDATKIAALTGTNTPEYFVAEDYRYFRPRTDAPLQFRSGVTETAGWIRDVGVGALKTFDRRSVVLANGEIQYKLAQKSNGVWNDLTVDEGDFFSLNSAATALTFIKGTDYLRPRTIKAADGNRVSFTLPNVDTRISFDLANSPGTNFFVEEWVGQQRNYTTHYNGTPPAVAPLAVKPACSITYPLSPQPDAATGTTIAQWYSTCFNYYTAEYYDKALGDLQLKGADASVPGANFYDAFISAPYVVAPLPAVCGTDAIPLAKVTVLGKQHCNWAVDANANHVVSDLFSPTGVTINSWSKLYGPTSFTVGAVTTVRTAGTAAQAGLPQQLKLTLNRTGSDTAGTGTLYSEFGAWTATSFTPTTEAIEWEIDAKNPNMMLIRWPFRDANDPRVKSNFKSDGTTASPANPVLTAQFSAIWNGNTFSLTPSNHTAPNYRRLAIALQDGVFVTGQYYGTGYNYNERYFTQPAMERGITALNYILDKLFKAGFKD